MGENVIDFKVFYLKQNEGHGNARRKGFSECKNEIVALMDADDICVPCRFEKQLAYFAANPNLSIVGGQIIEFVNDVGNVVGIRQVPTDDDSIKEYMKKRCPMNQMTVMFRKEELDRSGGYIDWYCEEDYYLWARMTLKNCVFANLPEVFLVLAEWIKMDSKGPVFFRQERITQYGRVFRIFKFRTMVNNADKIGSQVTVGGDARITRVGAKIRKVRLDEIPQLINVLIGDMSFVGTRPEVKRYVDAYTDEMYATLLLPAGITSEASIRYKDEDEILAGAEDVDKAYIEQVLPDKMKYNLDEIKRFGFFREIGTMFRTVLAVLH